MFVIVNETRNCGDGQFLVLPGEEAHVYQSYQEALEARVSLEIDAEGGYTDYLSIFELVMPGVIELVVKLLDDTAGNVLTLSPLQMSSRMRSTAWRLRQGVLLPVEGELDCDQFSPETQGKIIKAAIQEYQ
jgi:hypothetical protein